MEIDTGKSTEINYASLLDGRVMFGSCENCPMDNEENTIVINTITYENVKFEHKNLREYVLEKFHEPEERPEFKCYMKELFIEIFPEKIHHIWADKEGVAREKDSEKRIYIFDEDGTGASAIFVAFLVRYFHKHIHVNDIFLLMKEAYDKRTNKPQKWSNCVIPRIERHRAFIFSELNHNHFDSYRSCFNERVKSATKKNRIARMKGKVRCGRHISVTRSTKYKDLYVEGFNKILLEQERTKIKDYPELLTWYPQRKLIKYRAFSLTGHSYIDYARSIRNLWFSMFVYPEQVEIDEDGNKKLTPDFFRLQIELSHSSKKYTRHPLDKNFFDEKMRLPEYIFWQGDLLNYKKWKPILFSAIYERIVRYNASYSFICKMQNAGNNLYFLCKEGFDYVEHGMTYEEHFKTCNGEWGISQILVGMLTDQRPWREKINIDEELWME